MKKKIIKFKGDKETIEYKECVPRKLPLTLKYLAPYWHQAIRNVNSYEKRRDFAESHKLLSDDRIRKGLKLYKDKKILQSTITMESGGDVNAIVQSEDGSKKYRVIIKDYLPKRPPQYIHEREEYIANLRTMCQCEDHIIGRYKDNASIICKHTAAVIWFLIDKFNMPKIFIQPEERVTGWRKSSIIELETEIRALPLVKFSQHLNILLMTKFHGMNPAMALSIHKIDNKTNKELNKPQWMTFIDEAEVRKILKGTLKAYSKISKKDEEEIFEEVGGDIIKTIREKLKDIEDKFEKRQKELDEIVNRSTDLIENASNVMEEAIKLIHELQGTVRKTNHTIDILSNDYNNLKKDFEKVKNNFWIKLFGVK